MTGKKLILLYIMASAVMFFYFRSLSGHVRILELSGLLVLIASLIIFSIMNREGTERNEFSWIIVLLILSAGLSSFVAYTEHDQSVYLSLYEQRPVYFFLLYFLLHKIGLKRRDIENLVILLGITFAGLSILQRVLYPFKIVYVTTFWERGTLRIYLPGLDYLILAYFILINRLKEGLTVFTALTIGLFLTIILFSGTRQLIAPIFVLTLFFVLVSRGVKNRTLIIAGSLLVVVFMAIRYNNIILGLIDVSQKTQKEGAANIRVLAAKFFLFRFNPDFLAYLFGNSPPTIRSP